MRYCLVIWLLLIAAACYSQDEQTFFAPANPELKEYFQSAEKKALSYIVPHSAMPVFTGGILNGKSYLNLPVKCNMRDSGYVTTARNQASCGCCWAFATLGSVETSWIKNYKDAITTDLSEENMKNCHGYEIGGCTSGNHHMAATYLLRGDGPLYENEEPYVDSERSCNNSKQPKYLITNAVFLPPDINIVKQAVLDYGSVYTSLHFDAQSYNGATRLHNYQGNEQVNHAVAIIGWDDTKNYWIAKNSWGTGWGLNGIFYISFSDKRVLSTVCAFPERLEKSSDLKLFMHDRLGWISSIGYASNIAYGLVRFVADSSVLINKLGSFVNTENTVLDFEIYTEKKGDKLSNKIASMYGKKCRFPGYYSFDLDKPVTINKDEEFYIKVKYNTPGYNFPIPFESKYEEDINGITRTYANPEIATNASWISFSGSFWTTTGKGIADKEIDLCIRAYGSYNTSGNFTGANLGISPNPGDGILNMDFGYADEDILTIEIYDISGKKVVSEKIIKNKNQQVVRYSFSNLTRGTYIINISTGREKKSIKYFIL